MSFSSHSHGSPQCGGTHHGSCKDMPPEQSCTMVAPGVYNCVHNASWPVSAVGDTPGGSAVSFGLDAAAAHPLEYVRAAVEQYLSKQDAVATHAEPRANILQGHIHRGKSCSGGHADSTCDDPKGLVACEAIPADDLGARYLCVHVAAHPHTHAERAAIQDALGTALKVLEKSG